MLYCKGILYLFIYYFFNDKKFYNTQQYNTVQYITYSICNTGYLQTYNIWYGERSIVNML